MTQQLTDPWTEAMQRKHKEAKTLKYKTNFKKINFFLLSLSSKPSHSDLEKCIFCLSVPCRQISLRPM